MTGTTEMARLVPPRTRPAAGPVRRRPIRPLRFGTSVVGVLLLALLFLAQGSLASRLYSATPPLTGASFGSFNASRTSGCGSASVLGDNGSTTSGTLRAEILSELQPNSSGVCSFGYARQQSFANWSGPSFVSNSSGVFHARVDWKLSWYVHVYCESSATTPDRASAKLQLVFSLWDATAGAPAGPKRQVPIFERSGCGPTFSWTATGSAHAVPIGSNVTLTAGHRYVFELSLEVEAFVSGSASSGSCPPSRCPPPPDPQAHVDIGSGSYGAVPFELRIR